MSPKNQAVVLNGRVIAEAIKAGLKLKIAKLKTPPGLAAILVGDNSASELYINLKEKACQEVGINFHKYLCNEKYYAGISQDKLLELIDFLNRDDDTDGIIVQLPLPDKYDTDKIIQAVSPDKDVDGFNPQNTTGIVPPTVAAVIELLQATGEKLTDKSTLIIGHSDVFTKGLAKHLKQQLKIKKIKTAGTIPAAASKYDIIIIALGRAQALKKTQVKQGAIVIDVGINRLKGHTVGDVDPNVAEQAGYLSPVPCGVGPLTVACLLQNTYLLAGKH